MATNGGGRDPSPGTETETETTETTAPTSAPPPAQRAQGSHKPCGARKRATPLTLISLLLCRYCFLMNQSDGGCALVRPARRMRSLGALGQGGADVGAVVSVVSVPSGWVAAAPVFRHVKACLLAPYIISISNTYK